ncbi:MAG: DUF3795 domain-containing protein [Thermoguttaceae bacterium]|jgi:hypothetical protein
MDNNAFENVKDQIGSCGIWCGSCVVGNGVLRELTRRYEEIITSYGLEKWAPKDFDYGEFSKGLASIQRIPLCQGCLKGGGREDCEMRTCALSKGIQNCLECENSHECKHGEILDKMRSGALSAGLFVKTGQAGQDESLEYWISRLKSKWPCCILFKND